MKKFKLPLLLLAVCLIVCLIGVMAACNGETTTDGTQDNTDPILPSPPEEEKPEQTVEELSKAECESILQAKTENLLSSAEVANVEGIQLYKEYYPIPSYDDNYNPDFVLSSLFNFSEIAITKVNLNGGEVFGSCTLTAHSDGAVHSVYFVLKTNLFSLDRTSYEVLKEELAYLNAYYVSVYENIADIPATDGFFDFNSLVAGETVPSPLTEEDYKEQCTEIINAIALDAVNETMPSFAKVGNLQIKATNVQTGIIYCLGDFSGAGVTYEGIYNLTTNLNDLTEQSISLSYKDISVVLKNLEITNIESSTSIQPEVSAEAYANLVNFVISNSIGWGPAGTDVEILNVSTIATLLGTPGRSGCTTYVVKNDRIYKVIVTSSSMGSQEDRIEKFLNEENLQSGYTKFEISYDDYLSFDSIGSAG